MKILNYGWPLCFIGCVVVGTALASSHIAECTDVPLSSQLFSFKFGESLVPKEDFLIDQNGRSWFESRCEDLRPFKKIRIFVTPETKRIYMFSAEVWFNDAKAASLGFENAVRLFAEKCKLSMNETDASAIIIFRESSEKTSELILTRKGEKVSFQWEHEKYTLLARQEQCETPRETQNKIHITLPNKTIIFVPPTLEVQAGKYKSYVDREKKELFKNHNLAPETDNVVLQQAGLNNKTPASLKEYVRVIYNCSVQESFTSDMLKTVSKADLKEFEDIVRRQIMTELSMPTKFGVNRLIKWNPIQVVSLGNSKVIKLSYSRQLNSNPIVDCEQYRIGMGTCTHYIDVSYRREDADKWKPIVDDVVQSMIIPGMK